MMFARISLLILLGFLAVNAARASFENISFSDYITYGKSADGLSPILIADEDKSWAMAETCRTNISGPGMRLQLLRLSQADAATNYDAWYRNISATEAYLRQAIACAPFRGDSWIRNAMVSQAIAEQPQTLSAMLQNAASLNPVEQGQMIARMWVWARITAETQELSAGLISDDVDRFLRYGDRAMLSSVLLSPSPYIRSLARSRMAGLDGNRRRAIEAMDIE